MNIWMNIWTDGRTDGHILVLRRVGSSYRKGDEESRGGVLSKQFAFAFGCHRANGSEKTRIAKSKEISFVFFGFPVFQYTSCFRPFLGTRGDSVCPVRPSIRTSVPP